MSIAYLCLGSNKGDRVGFLQQAAGLLGATDNIKVIRTSSFYETQPWLEKDAPWFLNAVVEIKTSLTPQELLESTMKIEKLLGRNRAEEVNEERTLDIDILFYDKMIVDDENLKIPHMNMHKRAFVLVPFLEINPDFVHPALNKSISELYDELENPEEVYLYGTKLNEI